MSTSLPSISRRLDALDWTEIEGSLWNDGYATPGPLLSAEECRRLIRLYGESGRFRKRVDMARHQFGDGDYQYFSRPLPRIVQELRTHVYRHLAPIANGFQHALGQDEPFPSNLRAFLRDCHAAGQERPTPLLLHYEEGGYNCLHRDLYGEVWFPLQATILLSRPGSDFDGGEFLLVENRPRAQSRASSVSLARGEIVVFPTNERPLRGTRGFVRGRMRHGVSRIRGGSRYTLGLIFHDAA